MLDGAFAIVRESGPDALTARALAGGLGCSVKPIFDAYDSMEDLRHAVWERADNLYNERLRAAMAEDAATPYKASGKAYVDFARDEPHLFRMLFMRAISPEEREAQEANVEPVLEVLMRQLHVDHETAQRFHFEVWTGVHGLATMVATGYADPDDDLVERFLTDLFLGLRSVLREGQGGQHEHD
ncbi:MAG: TetR-like C-terminal domain-containing protein [Bifidobacterium sp.]|nr:TetR-like C-terminal domain-containing protein [Bifidobacterium sp.]